MRIFKNRWFAKFAGKEGISDKKLIQAVEDADAGSIDADCAAALSSNGLPDRTKGNLADIDQ